MLRRLATVLMLAFAGVPAGVQAGPAKATIVLVHGAFAESSSWNGVIDKLFGDGYPVITAANPLRSVAGDAAAVAAVVRSVKGPVVLVGHSYGGTVISAAATDAANVKALVFVAAFAPAPGESSLELTNKFPGSTLSTKLAPPIPLPEGGQDLYIQEDKFAAQFAADVPAFQARLMATTQRPITQAALVEKSTSAAWTTIPSWWIYGTADLNIPPAAMRFMAKRAHARKIVVEKGASHVVMVSHPHDVASLIEEAARAD